MKSKCSLQPFKTQFLKWVGNKQRYAHIIISYFPNNMGKYYEPFLGSGGVLATLSPDHAVGSDSFLPLMEIWQTLCKDPDKIKQWYQDRYELLMSGNKQSQYETIKASYNDHPNGADLLFICRSCYGGVIRFRQKDGYISTPVGPHNPIKPEKFNSRVDLWHERVKGTSFHCMDYTEAMQQAQTGDVIYCDPPYSHSQAILYGAQGFLLQQLFDEIAACKNRGVHVALSIDGTKKSGNNLCNLPIPEGIFEREVYINCGRSMLKRFQMNGKTLENHEVADRLLLTY